MMPGTTKMMMARKQTDDELFLVDREGCHRHSSGSSSSSASSLAKRLKTCTSASSSFSTRERKDRVGERVAALQQLVSPYGKTDTASVLKEASDYIRFLHVQVQVLSSPYLQTPVVAESQDPASQCPTLRSRGLCLVPLSQMKNLSSNNGADIWTPTNTCTSSRY